MENKELKAIEEKHKEIMENFKKNMESVCKEFQAETAKLFEIEKKINESK